MKIVNLTPHQITIFKDGEKIDIPASGTVLRTKQDIVKHEPIDGIAVNKVSNYVDWAELPPQEEGTVYVVSAIVAQACWHRDDILAPDTGAGAVRDEAGLIVGVKGLVRY